jgi:hypothetical protein
MFRTVRTNRPLPSPALNVPNFPTLRPYFFGDNTTRVVLVLSPVEWLALCPVDEFAALRSVNGVFFGVEKLLEICCNAIKFRIQFHVNSAHKQKLKSDSRLSKL